MTCAADDCGEFFVDADVAACPDAIGRVAAALRRQLGLLAFFGSYDDAPAAWRFPIMAQGPDA